MDAVNELENQYANKPPGYYEAERAELLRFVPEGLSRVLDVGCGNGIFGRAVKNLASCEVWGIEPSTEAATEARLHLDRVINGSFSATTEGLTGQLFDVVFFNDVLEHMVNPFAALLAAKSYLRPGGVVIASIPNILYFPTMYTILRSRDWRYEGSGVLDITHLRFFTKKSIIRLFEENGYEITIIEGINPYSFWKYNMLNKLLLNSLGEWKYLQFAVVARPK